MINAMRLGVGLWVETRRFGLGTMGRAALLRLGQDFRDFFFFYNGFYIFFSIAETRITKWLFVFRRFCAVFVTALLSLSVGEHVLLTCFFCLIR
jgi:hypothetical protein